MEENAAEIAVRVRRKPAAYQCFLSIDAEPHPFAAPIDFHRWPLASKCLFCCTAFSWTRLLPPGVLPRSMPGRRFRIPGVARVLTRADMPKFGKVSPPASVLRLPMQSDVVEHEGQAVAIVLAETLEAAEAGAGAVKVTMARHPHVSPVKARPSRHLRGAAPTAPPP
jgi:hypothetical protein